MDKLPLALIDGGRRKNVDGKLFRSFQLRKSFESAIRIQTSTGHYLWRFASDPSRYRAADEFARANGTHVQVSCRDCLPLSGFRDVISSLKEPASDRAPPTFFRTSLCQALGRYQLELVSPVKGSCLSLTTGRSVASQKQEMPVSCWDTTSKL